MTKLPVSVKVEMQSIPNVSPGAKRCGGKLCKALFALLILIVTAAVIIVPVILTRNKATATPTVVVATVIAAIIAVPLAVIQSRGVSSPIATTTVRNRVLVSSVTATVPRTNKNTASNKSDADHESHQPDYTDDDILPPAIQTSPTDTTAMSTSSTLSTTVLPTTGLSSTGLSSTILLSTTTSTASTVLGCYADFYPSSRSMPDASTTSNFTTTTTCINFCSSSGFPYSGTEYADECHCSAAAPTTLSSGCTMHCAGNSSLICGGANALSVVHSTIPTLPATNNTKRGLCWPWNNPASSFAFFSPSAIPWFYNWELWDPRANGTYSSAEYVPMVHTQAEATSVPAYFSSCYATHLLGFNEPDLPVASGGAYISPYNASVLWKQYIQPVKTRCNTSLGAPAVTNAIASGWGTDWLNQFFSNCTAPNCTFDFIPFHWYGQSVLDFETYVTNFHTIFPTYPLWVTEFQFTGVSNATTAYMVKQAMQWLDAQTYVVRYSMFGPMNPSNMAGIPNGAMVKDDLTGLTPVGLEYAGLL